MSKLRERKRERETQKYRGKGNNGKRSEKACEKSSFIRSKNEARNWGTRVGKEGWGESDGEREEEIREVERRGKGKEGQGEGELDGGKQGERELKDLYAFYSAMEAMSF